MVIKRMIKELRNFDVKYIECDFGGFFGEVRYLKNIYYKIKIRCDKTYLFECSSTGAKYITVLNINGAGKYCIVSRKSS